MEPVYLVVNPIAGRGRGARVLQPMLEALRTAGVVSVEHGVTRQAGDEEQLTKAAIDRGFRTIVAIGGDGTWGNVAHAILTAGKPVRLGLVAGGTGCDFVKSLGLPAHDPMACARIIHRGTIRRIDVGRIEDRHFLNVAGFGFDIAVIEDSQRVPFLAGGLLYLFCALRQIRAYSGFPVEIAVDDLPAQRHDLLMLIIANGTVFGGGFRIAPWSSLDDGQLECVGFDNLTVAQRLPAMVRLIRGRHRGAPGVRTSAGKRFRLRFERPPAYETDGDWRQARGSELTVETLPQALEVLVPEAGR